MTVASTIAGALVLKCERPHDSHRAKAGCAGAESGYAGIPVGRVKDLRP